MLFIDMVTHSKHCKVPQLRHYLIYQQGCTKKKLITYLETSTLLGTYRFTNSENKRANETKNENRITMQKEMKR